MYPYIINESSLVVMLNGRTYTLMSDHENYQTVRDAIREKNWDIIEDLVNVPEKVNSFGAGKVYVKDGIVYYNDHEIHNSLTNRILSMIAEGFDVNPLICFLENLMQNPSKRAVDELYGFLESCSLPITEDGHFLAYKKVRGDYKDIHSGTYDNSVGSILEMPRNMVDDERDRTCSTGLHFCSMSYLPHFGSNVPGDYHVMMVKVNPADVVSIPSDYNNAKGRACRYEVVGEHDDLKTEAFTKSVYGKDGLDYQYDLDGVDSDTELDDEDDYCEDDGYYLEHSDYDETEENYEATDHDNCSNNVLELTPDMKTQAAKYNVFNERLYTEAEALAELGISKDALRKRLARGSTVCYDKSTTGEKLIRIAKK